MDNSPDGWIVHICRRDAWHQALADGAYRAESLPLEGFIHCSRPDQVLWVANRFFPQENDLVLLWIDPVLLDAGLRWEGADEQVFPHVYGPINLSAVLAVKDFLPDADGVFRQPPTNDDFV